GDTDLDRDGPAGLAKLCPPRRETRAKAGCSVQIHVFTQTYTTMHTAVKGKDGYFPPNAPRAVAQRPDPRDEHRHSAREQSRRIARGAKQVLRDGDDRRSPGRYSRNPSNDWCP